MNLAITPDLIICLLDHHGPGDKTGIILTEDGWEVGAWADRPPSGLVALTKEDAGERVNPVLLRRGPIPPPPEGGGLLGGFR